MGNALRNQPFPSFFPLIITSPTYSVQTARTFYYLAIVALSFLLILPGVRGLKRFWLLLRVSAALWIAGVLVVCNYSAWYGGVICTKTQYKPHTGRNSPQEIQAEVGLHISLRGINITLIEKECDSVDPYSSPFPDELIYYNEHFSWSNPWSQGRQDFGKYGGKFKQQFREAKYRGVPYPITWIAEHFTIDGEQIRWYRKFRQAGWYTHAVMWTAFATHLFSVLLFTRHIRMGAWYMVVTGSLMITACLAYCSIISNDPVLKIHFPDQTLVLTFKYTFWLNLITGVGTLLTACVILVLDQMFPRKTAAFFDHNTTPDDSIFETDEGYESFLQKFTRISLKRLSKSTGSLSAQERQIKRRTRQPSLKQPPIDTMSVSEIQSNYPQEKSGEDSRPCSVVYSFPEISSAGTNSLTVSDHNDSNLSSMTCHELDMEVQVAQIVIQDND